MREALQWILWLVGLILQGAVLASLFPNPWSYVPMLFLYIVSLLCTTLADIFFYLTLTDNPAALSASFWMVELIRQSALFALVVAFLAEQLRYQRARRTLSYITVLGAIVFWGGSLLFYRQPLLNLWMTQVVRNLSFSSAMLTLILWFMLVSQRGRDMTKLLIIGGLGLQMAGEAIGQSIRQLQLSAVTFWMGNIIVVLAHFLCLAIWWQALARRKARLLGR
jgi:hypothetical protein